MTKTSLYQSKQPDENGLVTYKDAENQIWADLYAQQYPRLKTFMAAEYLAGFKKLNMPGNRIPQCTEISVVLWELTGWRVVPVPHLIPFRRFFEMLAQRQFPAASFIRSRKDFDYVQEPDIFHEVFGHTPLLTDCRFAAFSQKIGAAGLRAAPKDYAWLIRLYWFTIEFGLTRVDGKIKALGSGLASSPTELPYAVESNVPERRAFNVIDILRTPYRIDIHQPVYFVIEDLDVLFRAAERDLLADVHQAQNLGLFTPTYPAKLAS